MRFVLVFALGITMFSFSLQAQTSITHASGLELRLEPEDLQEGLPQAFRFVLLNRSNHDVRVPVPIVECGGSYTGAIWLRMHFVPLHPDSEGLGHGCAADRSDWPNIFERVKQWAPLKPGASVQVSGDRKQLFPNDLQAGTYEFWAEYNPPFITPDEDRALTNAGIDFPREKLSSNHTAVFKKP